MAKEILSMQNESIIKLIGHRPVYRVIRDSVTGFLVGIADDLRPTAAPEAEPLDRDARRRMLGGLPKPEFADHPA
jgi:hypothetical protein